MMNVYTTEVTPSWLAKRAPDARLRNPPRFRVALSASTVCLEQEITASGERARRGACPRPASGDAHPCQTREDGGATGAVP